MYSVLNALSEYTYFYISKKTLLHTLLLLVSKIVKFLQCILRETILYLYNTIDNLNSILDNKLSKGDEPVSKCSLKFSGCKMRPLH